MITTKTCSPAYHKEVDLYKLLAHPARLAILDALRTGEECVCHLEALLGYRQAYLSQQLAVLREAGLISDSRDGWNIYYRVAAPEIYTILDAVRTAASGESPSIPGRRSSQNCPCPKCQDKIAQKP
jgi:DNA-binding transcriptional ArsR family regulator